jgi:hypothetical protein
MWEQFFHRQLTGIHQKKFNKFPVGILLPLPAILGAFLQNPVAVIFDLEGSPRKVTGVIFR